MPKVELRNYNHDSDYTGLRTLLEEAGLYDEDYESAERLEEVSGRHPDMITVATIGGQVVGSVYFQDGVIPQAYRLAVREDHRRSGIGTRLMEAAEEQARALGHKYLELFIDPQNTIAQTMYIKRGHTRGNTYRNMFKQIAG
jgi:N-acetylglutamate synthase